MKLLIGIVAAVIVAGAVVTGCSDANRVSRNIATAADNFEIQRRIVFYNGITGDYMLSIEGLCSKGNDDPARQASITCKVGPNQYKKHLLGLSDNVTYFVEQVDGAGASAYHYRIIFKPAAIIPSIEVK